MTLVDWGIVVGLIAALWGLQMLLAYRQAQAFMAQVGRLRGVGRTAIGVSSTSRLHRRTYVALAADDGRVADAIKIAGWTVFARPRPADELRGRRLDVLQGDESDDLARAASMAASALLASNGTEELQVDEQGVEEVSGTG